MKFFPCIFFLYVFFQVALGSKSGEKNRHLASSSHVSTKENVTETSLTTGKQKFAVVEDFLDALDVNLEDRYSSKTLDIKKLYPFEEEIYKSYLLEHGSYKWALIFKRTIDKWNMFGSDSENVMPFAFISLIRVLESSGFDVDEKHTQNIPNDHASMNHRLKSIFKQISKKECNLKPHRTYQTLLWFFGKFKWYGSPEEIKAAKEKCTVEKKCRSRSNQSNDNSGNSEFSSTATSAFGMVRTTTQTNSNISVPVVGESNELNSHTLGYVSSTDNAFRLLKRQISSIKDAQDSSKSKFDIVSHLKNALDVDLKTRLTSTKDLYKHEKEIFPKTIANMAKINGTLFKSALEEWRMFPDIEFRVVPLAFFGLLRICDVSGFEVNKKIIGDEFKDNNTVMNGRVNRIFKQICKGARHLDGSEIYETLLLLFSNFLQHASREDLDAIKSKCPAEKHYDSVNKGTTSTGPNELSPGTEMDIISIQSPDDNISSSQTNDNDTHPGVNTLHIPNSSYLPFGSSNSSAIVGSAPRTKAFKHDINDLGFSEYLLQYHGISFFMFDDFQTNEPAQKDDIYQKHDSDVTSSARKRKLDSHDQQDMLKTPNKKLKPNTKE